MQPVCPPAVSALVGDHEWHRYPQGDRAEVATRWPGSIWRVGERLVRTAGEATIDAEVARSAWLIERFETPMIERPDPNWLVTTLQGAPAHRPERQPAPDQVPTALGAGLRRLHDLAPAACPFDAGWSMIVSELQDALATHRLPTAGLPAPYNRYEPARLLELVVEGRPNDEDLVVCHGAPVLPELFLDQGQLVGVAGLHRLGLADRHLDLAVAHRSIHEAFGPEAVFGFYDGYGLDPALLHLDHYLLLDLLLEATARVEEPG